MYNYIMNSEYIYLVTLFGCNSSAHDMLTPRSKVFVSYDAAYKHFLQVAPLDDPDNRISKHTITTQEYDANVAKNEHHIIIERISHDDGYLDGDGTCAKRPYGVVFAATRMIN